jgi:hypothetical protein
MLTIRIRSYLLLACVVLLEILQIAACAPVQSAIPTLKITGASDVIQIGRAAQADFQPSSGLELDVRSSKDPLEELRAGKADAILVGRDLTPQELEGTENTVIAYDAVCILISLRTYVGGTQQGTVGSLIQPISKFSGLKDLSLDDLKQFYADILGIRTGDDFWYLPQGYLTFQPYTVEDTLQSKEDADSPGHALGMWVWNFTPLGGELTTPGLMDTQAFLLQKLGYAQVDLRKSGLGFTPPNIGSEEEWISSRFDIAPEMDETISSWPFPFFLMPASRQVTERALQHGFSLRALSIDGVDPMGDDRAIYRGDYPLARKISLVVKKPVSANAEKFIQYLLSPAGQKAIKQASFLPLPLP